ncbi:efflux RND transporter permease subunit, partial [Desulfomarina sp.]
MSDNLSAWFTRNPVAANLLMLLVLAGGLFAVQTIRIEGFPAISPGSVTITTIYPGASAKQIDQTISRKIETSLEGMAGIKKISSFSEQDVSTVWVQKTSRFALNRFQNEIQERVNSITDLPRMAERPSIRRDEFKVEALLVQIYGDTDTATLQKTAVNIKKALLAHPKITRIKPFGLLTPEIRIAVDNDRLQAWNLSLNDISAAIQRASLDYRMGGIEGDSGQVLLRADSRAGGSSEFAALPLMTLPDGSSLLTGDVANVTDGFKEENGFARFQRLPSVGLQIYTSKKGHLLEVSEAAHRVVDKIRHQLPDNIKVDIWGEYAGYMKTRLSLLARNFLQGLLIVFALLAVFLNIRLAFWVAMGIPISLAGTLMLMGDRFFGYSLNEITTFGMIIVLGILVDDAVVVGESVFTSRRKIKDPVAGTIHGVKQVSTATVFGSLTTVAAFFPLLLINNDMGKVFAGFSVVVVIALLLSLLESKLILPAHLAAIRINTTLPTSGRIIPRVWRQIQSLADTFLSFTNHTVYQPLLYHALRHRYAAIVLLLTIALCSGTIISNAWVRTVFFPEVPGQTISVNLEMVSGSPLNLTRANIDAIEQAADELNREIEAELHTRTAPIAKIMTAMTGPLTALIFAELQPEDKRQMKTMETVARWRKKVGVLEGVESLSFSGSFASSEEFEIELDGGDETVLEKAATHLADSLATLEGISDVRDDIRQGKPQIRLKLKPSARHLGLTAADLARQIGDGFGGLEVQRIQGDGEEVRVLVKYKKQQRQHTEDLLKVRIQTEKGQWIPLSSAATVATGFTPSVVLRQNGKRVVSVKASLDKKIISPGEAFKWIKEHIIPEFKHRYPGVNIRGAGELQEISELKGGMLRITVMILLLIYSLLAVPLKSYWQPFVIMSVIPFAFVGAVLGHFITGTSLSILSFFGMMVVMGVVVNDSLVMITRFNELKKRGENLQTSLLLAGGSRFRAIFLTTVTTVCGLTPLLLETSEQAQYLIPAALSIAWGELFATPVTLVIVPVLIAVGNDLRFFQRLNPQRLFMGTPQK